MKDWLTLLKDLLSLIAMWHICATLGSVSLLAGLGTKVWNIQLGVSPGMELLSIVAGVALITAAVTIRWHRRKHDCK